MNEYKIKNAQTNQVEAVVMAHSVSGSAPAFTLFDARGFAVGSFRLQSGFELDIRSAPAVAPEPALPAVEAPEEQV